MSQCLRAKGNTVWRWRTTAARVNHSHCKGCDPRRPAQRSPAREGCAAHPEQTSKGAGAGRQRRPPPPTRCSRQPRRRRRKSASFNRGLKAVVDQAVGRVLGRSPIDSHMQRLCSLKRAWNLAAPPFIRSGEFLRPKPFADLLWRSTQGVRRIQTCAPAIRAQLQCALRLAGRQPPFLASVASVLSVLHPPPAKRIEPTCCECCPARAPSALRFQLARIAARNASKEPALAGLPSARVALSAFQASQRRGS